MNPALFVAQVFNLCPHSLESCATDHFIRDRAPVAMGYSSIHKSND